MSTEVGHEEIVHADAFAGTQPGEMAVCADLPLEQRIEALLLAADRPLSDVRLVDLLGLLPPPSAKPKKRKSTKTDNATPGEVVEEPEPHDDPATARARKHAVEAIHQAIATLNEAYAATGRTFRIEPIAAGWQILTVAAVGPLIARLRGERQQTRLSQPALETLAIIAYRQPILRADLESIRGVACGEVLKSLMDRRLVRIVGRAEEVGRPMLYGTTKEFLRIFGIANICDLPNGKELKGA
ncbi:MAG: SMC-Scp complex subunit ScpB [Phycisphaerae bacterium]|nr:SMC-Scp complex subunit ScpB [Phycisphaerae bacterium]